MILTIFRARVRPEARVEYAQLTSRILELARQTPGYLSCKDFVGADGECVTLAEFDSERALRVWSEHREHVEAMRKARASFCLEYRIQVCSVQRGSSFPSRLSVASLGG
jgi:heme-degrading monooxygenase HmoA